MPEDMLFYVGVKSIIRNTQGQVLLLKISQPDRAGHYWDLPGGRIKKGESAKEALYVKSRKKLVLMI